MVFTYNTISDVTNELKNRRSDAIAKRDAWQKVTVDKKKNGDEFARIGQAVNGARIGQYLPVEDDLHPYLTVCARNSQNGDYIRDEMRIFWYLDELPKEDERRAAYIPQCVRQTTPKTPDEIRAAIKQRVEMYNEKITSYDEQIKKAPAAFKAYRDAITKATAKLIKTAGKNGVLNNSLYYLVSECK